MLFDNELAKQKSEILFVKVEQDGFDLGATKRSISKNDLPIALEILNKWRAGEKVESNLAVYVEKAKIAENEEYNLTGDRYRVATDYTNAKWPMVELGEVCNVRDGTHDSPKQVQDGYPLITSKNIKDGHLDFSNISYISEEDFKKVSHRSYVNVGDIIIPMIGTIDGACLIESKEKEFAIKNVALFKKSEQVLPKYLLNILNSDLVAIVFEHQSKKLYCKQ